MIAELFEPLDIECLVKTAVELSQGEAMTDLSQRQRDMLDRASEAMHAEHADQPLPQPQRATILPVRHETGSNLVIRNFLDLSTAHLREETRANLNSYEDVVADQTAHGWLVYASENANLTEGKDYPAELLPIVKLARANGCEYILFDAGATETDTLPTFDGQ